MVSDCLSKQFLWFVDDFAFNMLQLYLEPTIFDQYLKNSENGIKLTIQKKTEIFLRIGTWEEFSDELPRVLTSCYRFQWVCNILFTHMFAHFRFLLQPPTMQSRFAFFLYLWVLDMSTVLQQPHNTENHYKNPYSAKSSNLEWFRNLASLIFIFLSRPILIRHCSSKSSTRTSSKTLATTIISIRYTGNCS